MAILLPSSVSVSLPSSHHKQLSFIKPNTLRSHSQQQRTTDFHPKRRQISFTPLCARKSRPEEPRHKSQFVPVSPLEHLAVGFYSHINLKKLDELSKQLVADGCIFEDMAFSEPFREMAAIRQFLGTLTEAMGKDAEFVVDDVVYKEEEDPRVAVLWHLEWQKKPIPFATGCSFFTCSMNEQSPQIKKALIYSESPLKAGKLVLELLKIVSSLFDNFPNQAKWFLENAYIILQNILRGYKMLVEPFILPVIMYYTHIWTYGAKILGYTFTILKVLLKIFM